MPPFARPAPVQLLSITLRSSAALRQLRSIAYSVSVLAIAATLFCRFAATPLHGCRSARIAALLARVLPTPF